jgi:hypothetical protein
MRALASVLICTLLGAVAAWVGVATSVAQSGAPLQPPPPLVHAEGGQVVVAYRLPRESRVDQVQILRARGDGANIQQVAELDPNTLSWTDTGVELGVAYTYILRTLRGLELSPPSLPVEVTIGGGTTVTLLGASMNRAWIEVVLYRDGERLAARFVHRVGDSIGDHAYSQTAGTIVDFRPGVRLERLELRTEAGTEPERLPLLSPDGEPVRSLTGNTPALTFELPAERHEQVIAHLVLPDRRVELPVGQTIRIDQPGE